MIKNIQELRERLFTSGIVKNEQELQGCTQEEIAYIESKYGVLQGLTGKSYAYLGIMLGSLLAGQNLSFTSTKLLI